jgi:hypothetical protein
MRKVLIAAVVLLAAVSPSAHTQSPPWAQKLFLGVNSHDFGTCPAGAQLKHRFVMKNIYAVPLEITEVRSSCGCLTAKASTTKLAPKEEAYIDVNMDATKFSGHKSLTLFVSVGPKYISTAAIQITAHARTDVTFNPGTISFGVVEAGASPDRVMNVEYTGAQNNWAITEVIKNKSAPFKVSAQEIYRQQKGLLRSGKVGYQIQVTLDANAAPGSLPQELLLKTNDPASPHLTVVVEGNVQAPLTLTPDHVKFQGPVRVGEKATQKAVVRGNQPFRIMSVEGIGNGVTAEWPSQAAAFHIINIHCQPTQPGALNRTLTIRTDSGKGDVGITLPVTATAVP